MNDLNTSDYSNCADLIGNARNIVALTGAGISTSAGIPDYRGPNGIYTTRRYASKKAFDIKGFHKDATHFYDFAFGFIGLLQTITPTFTHRFLARLEDEGRLSAIVTQNVDMLHQASCSRNVIELHGSYSSAACIACGKKYEDLTKEWWHTSMRASSTPPKVFCRDCGSVIKPGLVFFGEELGGSYDTAEKVISGCDLLLVLGTSLNVSPASDLPYFTKAPTVIVNKGEVILEPSRNRHFVDCDLDSFFRMVDQSMQ